MRPRYDFVVPCLLNGLYGCELEVAHRGPCEPPRLSQSTTLCLSDFAYRRSARHTGRTRYWFPSALNNWYVGASIEAAVRAWSQAQPVGRGWQYLRSVVMESHDQTCSYCGERGSDREGPDGRRWHVDHVVPVARGGRDEIGNLVLACARCNIRKGVKPWTPKFGPLAVA